MKRVNTIHPLRTTIFGIIALIAMAAVAIGFRVNPAHADTSGTVSGEAYTADASAVNDVLSINKLNDVVLPPGGSAGASINTSSGGAIALTLTSGAVTTTCTDDSAAPNSIGGTCTSTINDLNLAVDLPVVGGTQLLHADALTATASASANNALPTASADSSVTNLAAAGATTMSGTVTAPSTINLSVTGAVSGTVSINSTTTSETATSASGTAITLQVHLDIVGIDNALDLTVGYANAAVSNVVITGTATPSPSATTSTTATTTPSATATGTGTGTTTATATPSRTGTATSTATPTRTSTATATNTRTGSATSTPTSGNGSSGNGTPSGGNLGHGTPAAGGGNTGGGVGHNATPRAPVTGNAGPGGSNHTELFVVLAAIIIATAMGLGAYARYGRRD